MNTKLLLVSAVCLIGCGATAATTIDTLVIDGETKTLTEPSTITELVMTNGVLDLAGFDCTVDKVTMVGSPTIKNSHAETRATFTASPSAADTVAIYPCALEGNFVFKRAGVNGTVSLKSNDIRNKKIEVAEGALTVLPGKITCNMVRLTVTKTMGQYNISDSWISDTARISEFVLINDGVDVPWLAGTTDTLENYATDGDWNITNNKPSTFALGIPVIIDFNGTLTFDSFTYGTSDYNHRDPSDFTLEAGIVANGVTNWYVVADFVRGHRFQSNKTETHYIRATPAYPAAWQYPSPRGVAFPEEYELAVAENAQLDVQFLGSDLTALCKVTGAGELKLTGRTAASLSTTADFSGAINVIDGIVDADVDHPAAVEVNHGTLSSFTTGNAYSGETTIGASGLLRANEMYCKYIRFSVQKTTYNDPTQVSAQLQEMCLYYNGTKLVWPSNLVATGNGGAPKLVDNDYETDANKILWSGVPVTITLPEPVRFNGYGLYTGNDYGGYNINYSLSRHPVSWTFEVSTDGENWFIFDKVEDNWWVVKKATGEKVELPRHSFSGWGDLYGKTLFYTFENGASILQNTLSPSSPLNLQGVATVATLGESVPSLEGAGALTLGSNTVFAVNPGTGKTFTGTVDGGVFTKAGDGVQTLGGTLSCGELVVEGGELNLANAVLDGVTNIVLKGGFLSGTAMAQGGDLTVTAAGGATCATIGGIGALTLATEGEATFKVANVWAGEPITQNLFEADSIDDASQAVARAGVMDDWPSGYKFKTWVRGNAIGYSLLPVGFAIILR